MDTFFSALSGCSAAVAAYFSFQAIREAKKNVFLVKRNDVAINIDFLYRKFQFEYETFYISKYLGNQEIIVSSKYFVDEALFEKFIELLHKLHRLEHNSKSGAEIDDLLREIDQLFIAVLPSQRLDE